MCILLSFILVFALCSPVFAADPSPAVDNLLWLSHVAMTILGTAKWPSAQR
jgi:hypothetical protein